MYIEPGILIALVVMVIWWRLSKRAQRYADQHPNDPKVIEDTTREREREFKSLVRDLEDHQRRASRSTFLNLLLNFPGPLILYLILAYFTLWLIRFL